MPILTVYDQCCVVLCSFSDKVRICRASQRVFKMCGLQWLTILAFLFLKVLSGPESDIINSLPGQPAVTFKQYAGYVTVDEKSGRALFYYFVEAEKDPDLKPLVVWLNGGPGCSSFGIGALSENGPFHPRGGKLIGNEYSWNKEANMLYLETPAGVGFSYSNDSSYYLRANDAKTAEDNLLFLHGWFGKFPEYKTRDLYFTGESYAGHYIPQWAELIVEANRKEKIFNLKGIAIGNPLLDFFTDFNARAEYLWSHGLISDPTYNIMNIGCNYTRYVDEYYRGAVSSTCEEVYSIVSTEVSQYIDRYDVTLDICLSSLDTQKSKMLAVETIGARLAVQPDVCVENEATSYLNMVDVQKAFHARLVGSVKRWDSCSEYGFGLWKRNSSCYQFSIAGCIYSLNAPEFFEAINMPFNKYIICVIVFWKIHYSVLSYDHHNLEIPTVPLLGKLAMAGIRVLIYSGDQDSVIPLTGTRTLVNNLAAALKLNTTVPYGVWFQGKQVAGWVQVYGNILSFATVRGAAHEVPFSQPERSLVLFKAFLQGHTPPTVMM